MDNFILVLDSVLDYMHMDIVKFFKHNFGSSNLNFKHKTTIVFSHNLLYVKTAFNLLILNNIKIVKIVKILKGLNNKQLKKKLS